MIQAIKSKLNKNPLEIAPNHSGKFDIHTSKSKLTSVSREGYFTVEEFRKIAIEKGNSFCDKHGII
jgi:flagellar basal body rod protein FlgG